MRGTLLVLGPEVGLDVETALLWSLVLPLRRVGMALDRADGRLLYLEGLLYCTLLGVVRRYIQLQST
jgi:hypothetical protein